MGAVVVLTPCVEFERLPGELEISQFTDDLGDPRTHDGVAELDHTPAVDADQVVVPIVFADLGVEPGLAVAEAPGLGEAVLDEQLERGTFDSLENRSINCRV